MRWLAIGALVCACGNGGGGRAVAIDARAPEPTPPPREANLDPPSPTPEVPDEIAQLERAAGIDPSNPGPMIQQAIDMMTAKEGGTRDSTPVETPEHGVNMKVFQMPEVHFDGALATMELGRLRVFLVEQPATCDTLYDLNDVARLMFDVPPGPGNTYFAGHDIGVNVNGQAGYMAAADPAQVVIRLDRVRVHKGAHITGTIDAVARTIPDLEAHGHFDAILCDVDPVAHVPAAAPKKAVAVGTAIARLAHNDDGDQIGTIELYDQQGLTCDTAAGETPTRAIWEMGGTGAAHPLTGVAQPALLAFDPEDFSKTSFWDGWVRFDNLAFTPGDEVRLSMWAQDTHGKRHVGGTLRALVCAATPSAR
jgi:hypothetical protein